MAETIEKAVGDVQTQSPTSDHDSKEVTQHEMEILPKVYGHIPRTVWSIAAVEFAERFAYYGTITVYFNFLYAPLPPGSTTGASGTDGQAGALGMGQRTATALTTFNQFWAYVCPLLGAYVAETYWGRYVTVQVGAAIAIVGHILLIISALPPVIAHADRSIVAFILGLIVFGIGVGCIKPNISPMVGEQYIHYQPSPTIRTLRNGSRVVVDPKLTITRVYMYYYFLISAGALVGGITMVYAEKYVGFWLSFTLPTVVFLIGPFIMVWHRKRYVRVPPNKKSMHLAIKVWGAAISRNWSWNPIELSKRWRGPDFWKSVKPSYLTAADRTSWMDYEDDFVDHVKQALDACKVFCWFPLFWLPYIQLINNIIAQAASLELHGLPNDILYNLEILGLIIFIPIFDQGVYRLFAICKIRFSPLKRMFVGFICAALSMVVAAIIQHYIYKLSPCGNAASTCDDPAPINVWVQLPAIILISIAEILTIIPGLEYAFVKSPTHLRSMVTALFFFATAFASAIAQAFVGFLVDPLLTYMFATIALIAGIGGIMFWIMFRKQDQREKYEEIIGVDNTSGLGYSNDSDTRNDNKD